MGEHLENGRELTERAWRVLAEGHRQVAVLSNELRLLGERASAAQAEFRSIAAGVRKAQPAGTDRQMPAFHTAYAYIAEAGGGISLARAIVESEYAEVCERWHWEVDVVLSGRHIYASSPDDNHCGFVVVGRDGLMRPTQYKQVQGLYHRSDVINGGMYLLAAGDNTDELCQVYVPLFAKDDPTYRRLSDFVVVPPAH